MWGLWSMGDGWQQSGIDVTVASTARVYDYLLGGKDNFPSDRAVAEQLLEAYPPMRDSCVQNRGFLIRAVRFLSEEAGIRRFLDIGTGLPTQQNVHQVAQASDPQARVVYVDNDPIVLAHARALLAGAEGGQVEIVDGDLTEPQRLLAAPEVRALLEPGEPVALLMVALLHFVTDSQDPHRAVATLVDALPSGSYVVISHGAVFDQGHEGALPKVAEAYESSTSSLSLRTSAEITRFMDGLELVEPGLVWVTDWRPDRLLKPLPGTYAAVARKP